MTNTANDVDHTQTFALYLAKQYIAKKGFNPGTVPEAEELTVASDIVLTRADGMNFHILCLVDCEKHPEKQFGLPPAKVQEIGEQCLKYSGKLNRSKMPVVIQIIEVGAAPISAEDQQRLKPFKRKNLFSKVIITASRVDTVTQSIWASTAFQRLIAPYSFVKRLMQKARVSDADLMPAPPAAIQEAGVPILTYAFLALLAIVFAAEYFYAVEPSTGLFSPHIRTLVALGGLNPALVFQAGEAWRIFSAALLHADLLHLILNGVALYMAGVVLERLVGRTWFFALFVIGAVGGSLMSLAVNPATMVSVGASGAIMGLLAAAFVCSFRASSPTLRAQAQVPLMQVLIPSLIPIAVSRTGQQIDFAAHIGGALICTLVSILILKTWPRAKPLPRFTPFARAVVIVGVSAFAFSFVQVAQHYSTYALDTLLVPNAKTPKNLEEIKLHSVKLVSDYPRDPRTHLWHAQALWETNDLEGVERELRNGLSQKETWSRLAPQLKPTMQAMLALLLVEKGQQAEAKTIAREPCVVLKEKLQEALSSNGLCN